MRPSDHALKFEAIKVAMRQTKDGYALTLVIHPDDVPPELFASPVGQRYLTVVVGLDGQDQPIEVKQKPVDTPESNAVQYAGMLCREPKFWEFLTETYRHRVSNEQDAADFLRESLGVTSRSEIATDEMARRIFNEIADRYRGWAGIK